MQNKTKETTGLGSIIALIIFVLGIFLIPKFFIYLDRKSTGEVANYTEVGEVKPEFQISVEEQIKNTQENTQENEDLSGDNEE